MFTTLKLLDALKLQATQSENRSAFIADALASEQEALHSGSVYEAEDIHRYLREHAAGKIPNSPPIAYRR